VERSQRCAYGIARVLTRKGDCTVILISRACKSLASQHLSHRSGAKLNHTLATDPWLPSMQLSSSSLYREPSPIVNCISFTLSCVRPGLSPVTCLSPEGPSYSASNLLSSTTNQDSRGLLQRHYIVHGSGTDQKVIPAFDGMITVSAGRTPVVCSNSAKTKTKCDQQVLCSRCAGRGINCTTRVKG
jgi:hypothetical protein